jgi:putative ABC transport system substrate-binding protein
MVRTVGRAAVAAGLGLLLLAPARLPAQSHSRRVVVIASQVSEPYRKTVEGFRAGLAQGGAAATITEITLSEENTAAAAAPPSLLPDGVDLIFAVGGRALRQALDAGSQVPVVAALVTEEGLVDAGSRAYGVILGHPLETQVAAIRAALPRARSLGIVYSETKNESVIDAARTAAAADSFDVAVVRVQGAAGLGPAVDSLAPRVDAMWALPDALLTSPQNVKKALLVAFRLHVPFVGLSPAWANGGALLALGWDFIDIGRQCAETATAVLAGRAVPGPTLAYPRKASLFLNEKTARILGLEIAAEARERATAVGE